MKVRLASIAAAILVLAPLSVAGDRAAAAGFDCRFAKSRVEKLICADTELSRLDSRVNELFQQIEGETRGVDGETGEVIDNAGEDQKHWRETVRDSCQDTRCLKKVYPERITEMRRKWAQALSPADQE